MSKKIFHSAPRSNASTNRILHVDPDAFLRPRKRKAVDFVEGEESRGKLARENRKKVKADARANRDTTRQQRKLQKKPKTAIDFKEGDLVYHFRKPDTFMLVTGVVRWSEHGTWVQCMKGLDFIEHKAMHLRKAEDF